MRAMAFFASFIIFGAVLMACSPSSKASGSAGPVKFVDPGAVKPITLSLSALGTVLEQKLGSKNTHMLAAVASLAAIANLNDVSEQATKLGGAINDQDCTMDLPIDQNGNPKPGVGIINGTGTIHAEISGEKCALYLYLEVKAEQLQNPDANSGGKLKATYYWKYQAKSPELLKQTDVSAFEIKGTMSGDVGGDQSKGRATTDMVYTITGTGTSQSKGAFSTVTDIHVTFAIGQDSQTGFSMDVNESSQQQYNLTDGDVTFLQSTILGPKGQNDTYQINGKDVSAEAYKNASSSFKFPGIDDASNFGAPSSPPVSSAIHPSLCSAMIFDSAKITQAVLDRSIASKQTLTVAPLGMAQICGGPGLTEQKVVADVSVFFQFQNDQININVRSNNGPQPGASFFGQFDQNDQASGSVGQRTILFSCETVQKCP